MPSETTYTQEYPLGELSWEQFIAFAHHVLVLLDWNIKQISSSGILAETQRSQGLWASKITITNEGSTVTLKSEGGDYNGDWTPNQTAIEKFLATLETERPKFTPEALSSMYEEIKNNSLLSVEALKPTPKTFAGKMKGFIAFFLPTRGFAITPILVDINIVLFILMVISGANIIQPDTHSLILWGANSRLLTMQGEPWRLLTACFLHIGIFHLLMNMYALILIGVMLEPLLGTVRYLAIYIMTGIVASTVSLWWHFDVMSAGASGAIFGMYGVFIALLTTNILDTSKRNRILSTMGVLVLYNLLYGMKAGIDNSAHIGGLVSGIVAGYICYPSVRAPENKTIETMSLTAIVVLSLSFSAVLYSITPNDYNKYIREMHVFTELQERGINFYKIYQHASPGTQLFEIDSIAIPSWKEAKRIVLHADSLQVPDALHDRDKALLEYCNLRIELFGLYHSKISERSSTYDNDIKTNTEALDIILKKLNTEK